MALVYETEQIRTGGFFNPSKMNPVKQWLKHYANYKYLRVIHDSTKSGMEKRQANQEIQIAEKKLNYWYKLTKCDSDWLKELETGRKELDQQWQQGPK
jgi:hypothetical protein